MSLKLMYITNNPQIALIAQNAGVDRIFIDLETLGKLERQGHLDSVKSQHSINDIGTIKPLMNNSELLVRVNPIHSSSDQEIIKVIEKGADIIMLPMFKTVEEVRTFIDIVSGRAKVMLLIETKEAIESIDTILNIDGIDEMHIGLNDLHLAYGKKFMFELLIDGTVSELSQKLREKGVCFGVGGIARIGYGVIPAELIIAEHYRLGSQMAILSRSFCNANYITNEREVFQLFKKGVSGIRKRESEVRNYSKIQFEENYEILSRKINNYSKSIK